MSGYYWCDKCDNPANGRICRTCRKAARYVVNKPTKQRIKQQQAEFFELGRQLRK